MLSIMLNYVIYPHFCHYIDDIVFEWYLISFLMIILYFYFTLEVYLNTFGLEEMNLNLDLSMEVNVNMLDQLILLVQLSDVSVTNTNGSS